MNILLTGGAGFIGFHVARALLERGDYVVIADNFSDYYDPKLKHDRIRQLERYPKLEVCKADVSVNEELDSIFSMHKFDKICHLAAQAGVRHSLKDPFKYELWNNLGTLNVLEMARKYDVKDIVLASSSSVYGCSNKVPFSEDDTVDTPVSFYAATKKANELYAHVYHKLFGLNCICFRLFTVYGPWGRPDMALFKFVKNITEDKPIELYNNGEMKRDFTYITDIVNGIVKAIDKPFPYEIINLGNNKPIELSRFVEIIEKTLVKKAKKRFLPVQQGDMLVTFADISKAEKLLGYKPLVGIEEGIKEFIKWYKEYTNQDRK